MRLWWQVVWLSVPSKRYWMYQPFKCFAFTSFSASEQVLDYFLVSDIEEVMVFKVFKCITFTQHSFPSEQVLDYFPVSDIEEVTVFDAPRSTISASTRRWRIPEDLVDFPIMSSSRKITIRLTVRGIRSGRLAFAVISREWFISLFSFCCTYVS